MKIALAAFRRSFVVTTLCTTLGLAHQSSALAQGYGSPYAPPAGGVRPIDRSPRPYVPLYQPPIWEGLYLGGHLGGETVSLSANGFDADRLRGMTGGLHLGYNWQTSQLVGGFEVDGSANAAHSSQSYLGVARVEGSHDWLASLRLRVGYAAGPTLFYATGGYAATSFSYRGSVGPFSASTDMTMHGVVLGGGIEMKFSDKISARIEGLHYQYFEKTLLNIPGASVIGDGQSNSIRAGISYHFN